MSEQTGAERLAGRSRAVTIVALALLTFLAWAWLWRGGGMAAMPMDGMAPMAWDFGQWLLAVAMWWVMMIAMMLPSASPVILLYGRVHRRSQATPPPTAAFLGGYLAGWFGFALAAAGLQVAVTSPISMAIDSATASGALLIAAGLYQLSPFKDACLASCRSPADFLTRHYRPGAVGAWRLGLIHGAYCIGCCWLLMALLFVVGVMNLPWVAALTVLVAAEKLLPGGGWVARLAGAAFVLWGAFLLLR